jgi:hypothetical protein
MREQPGLADNVARTVLDCYHAQPNAGKPTTRSNGIAEWTILASNVKVIFDFNVL